MANLEALLQTFGVSRVNPGQWLANSIGPPEGDPIPAVWSIKEAAEVPRETFCNQINTSIHTPNEPQ